MGTKIPLSIRRGEEGGQMVNVENYYGSVIYRTKKVYRALQKAGVEHIELRELIQKGFEG